MKGQAGKCIIHLVLSLVFLSALLFTFLGNKGESRAQSLTGSNPEALVEFVNPHTFMEPTHDYEYDLYRKDGDQLTFVPPSEMNYAFPAPSGDMAPTEFQVAADQPIPPASREVTINLTAYCPNLKVPFPSACDTLNAGNTVAITFDITPATQTVELEDGTLQTVNVLPSSVDMYMAVRTPMSNLLFVNRVSRVTNRYFFEPVALMEDWSINLLSGTLAAAMMKSSMTPGMYRVYCAMVEPGEKQIGNPNKWLSNLATVDFPFAFFQQQ